MLDAWAVVAYLKAEPSARKVKNLMEAGDAVISDINLGEALYTLSRIHGRTRALELVRGVRAMVSSERPDWPLVTIAAALKADNRLSYADAFVVATALRHSAPLYTGDPEIVALSDIVQVVDLRKESE